MKSAKLFVFLFCFFSLLYLVVNGLSAISPFNGPLDGYSSLLDFVGWFVRMIGYAFIATLFSITFWFICTATKAGAQTLELVGRGLKSVYSAMSGASTDFMNQPVAKEHGVPVSLSYILQSISKDLSGLKEDITRLKAKTDHIEPPPPPKTETEILREKLEAAQAQIDQLAKMQQQPAKLAALKAAQEQANV